MKFRFCGELDCPDWVLAEIATLSKITSVKMKLLASQVVNGILGTPIDFNKVSKLTADAKYESGDIKAGIAALTFILTSAAKHSVEEECLSNELQQLGLPKELTSAVCRVFSESFSALQKKLKSDSLKLTEIADISWKVDYILWSSLLNEVNDPSVQLNLHVKKHGQPEPAVHSFTMSSNKATLLLHELKQVYSMMEEISNS